MAEMTGRDAAVEALQDRGGMVTVHLDRLLSERPLPPAEAHLAAELVCGVTRRRRTLDAVIRAHSDRPNRKPPPMVREILRTGAYQLLMLDRVPDFAVVDEAVGQCRRGHPRRAGFVNAVLREIARGASEAVEGPPPLDRRTIAIAPDRYRTVGRDVFRDPADRPVEHFGEIVSLPNDLAERWLAQADSATTAFRHAMQVNARPPLTARVNLARTTVAAVLDACGAAGVEAERHANGRCVVFRGHVDLSRLDVFNDGRITPQDATATEPVEALDVQPGMRVLDFCAAPGAKTVQIAEKLRGAGEVVALDVHEDKLARIREAVERCGLDNVRLLPASRAGSLELESFDRVLVDAPCSNTGVLARRVEARWRFETDRIGRIAADQRQILAMAAMFCAPAGRIVYSTCSIEPEENDEVVRAFAKRDGRAKVVDRLFTRPQGFGPIAEYRDGGFWAALRRS